MRMATEADNSALVMVRAALSLTNYSSTVFSVVAATERASKYSLRSVANLVGPFDLSGSGTCISVL